VLQMMQGFGDAGKVGAVRRGCHATDAGPTTTRSVRASIHGTSTAEHRDALRRINRLSSRGLCIRKYPINFHQVTSAAALSCPAAVTSHQYQTSTVFSVALTKLGPRTSPFPAPGPLSGSHPQRGSLFHSSDLIPSPFSFMASGPNVPSSLMLGEGGTGSEATDKPLPSRCRSTTSSALCFADFFLMLSFSPAASLQRTCLS
jgi:hypothetical protein